MSFKFERRTDGMPILGEFAPSITEDQAQRILRMADAGSLGANIRDRGAVNALMRQLDRRKKEVQEYGKEFQKYLISRRK